MMHIILLLSICVALNNARCPYPSELPKRCGYRGKYFMCARLYDIDNHVDSLSCRGDYFDMCNGEMIDWKHGWNDRVSAVVVSDGCKLYAYVDGGYGGNRNEYTGKNHYLPAGWAYSMSSWICRCDFSNAVLQCTPTEEYEVVTSCGNTESGEAECSHQVQEGISLGNSVTHGKTLSNSVEASIGAVFKDVFSVGLSASTTTEYSWSRSRSQTFTTLRTTSITCGVPVGKTVKILQVVGKCGDTIVYTPHFICQ